MITADGDAMLDYVTDRFTFLSCGDDLQAADSYAEHVTANHGTFKLELLGAQSGRARRTPRAARAPV